MQTDPTIVDREILRTKKFWRSPPTTKIKLAKEFFGRINGVSLLC